MEVIPCIFNSCERLRTDHLIRRGGIVPDDEPADKKLAQNSQQPLKVGRILDRSLVQGHIPRDSRHGPLLEITSSGIRSDRDAESEFQASSSSVAIAHSAPLIAAPPSHEPGTLALPLLPPWILGTLAATMAARASRAPFRPTCRRRWMTEDTRPTNSPSRRRRCTTAGKVRWRGEWPLFPLYSSPLPPFYTQLATICILGFLVYTNSLTASRPVPVPHLARASEAAQLRELVLERFDAGGFR